MQGVHITCILECPMLLIEELGSRGVAGRCMSRGRVSVSDGIINKNQ
jgi:hypothetical protein